MKCKCYICNKEFNGFNPIGRHLIKIHGISVQTYYDKYLKRSDEGVCEVCGRPTEFGGLTKGYRKFCSSKCASKSENVKKRRKDTNIIKYGTAAAAQNEKVKEKISKVWHARTASEIVEIKEKIKQTNLERYGVENPFAADEIKEKIKNTLLDKYGVDNIFKKSDYIKEKFNEKYGVDNPGQLDSIKEKIATTNLQKYGYTYALNNADVRTKANLTKRRNTIAKLKKYLVCFNTNCEFLRFYNNDHQIEYDLKCNVCNNEFHTTYESVMYYKEHLCPFCNKHNNIKSKQELEVIDYIQSLYAGEIQHSCRSILNGKEIDIYIPDKKLAFEYDGLYWHSELYVHKNYHLRKTDECMKLGIQLIHIFEDEWLYKKEIVKSRISGLFNNNKRIFARKCKIAEVSYKDVASFLDENHIQGACVSKYNYGLYHDGELVSVMTFGKSRFKRGEYEMLRFCNRLYTNVVGGASKLFSRFLKDHPEINEVVSFADRRWSIGNLYEKLGFEKISVTAPAYYYIVGDIRRNRVEFQKHKLVKEGFDENLTEHEIMLDRKIYRIYDCGNIKYVFRK